LPVPRGPNKKKLRAGAGNCRGQFVDGAPATILEL